MAPARSLALALLAGMLATSGSGCAGDVSAREAALGEPRVLQGPGWWYRAEVPLPFEIGTVDATSDQLSLGLEGSVPIRCFVSKEEVDLAPSVARTARAILAVVADDAGQPVTDRDRGDVFGGAADGAPYLGAHWRYRVGDAQGTMKVAAANKRGRGIVCNHYDAGFVATFDGVFRGLVESFEVSRPPTPPDYAEVRVLRGDAGVVGVEWLRLVSDDDGDTRVALTTSLLLPTTTAELAATQIHRVEWSAPDGSLINAWLSEAGESGEHTRLGLRRLAEGAWQAQGVHRGTAIEAPLPHRGDIGNTWLDLLALGHRLVPRGEDTAVPASRWMPGDDPLEIAAYEWRVTPVDPSRVGAGVGASHEEGQRSADGMIERGRGVRGQRPVTLERVFQEGGLPTPGVRTSRAGSPASLGSDWPKRRETRTGR